MSRKLCTYYTHTAVSVSVPVILAQLFSFTLHMNASKTHYIVL